MRASFVRKVIVEGMSNTCYLNGKTQADAGAVSVFDAGIPVDGGSESGQQPGTPASCGCGSGQGATSLVVALLIFVSARRRQRHQA